VVFRRISLKFFSFALAALFASTFSAAADNAESGAKGLERAAQAVSNVAVYNAAPESIDRAPLPLAEPEVPNEDCGDEYAACE
jgi:hypothetical protein